LSANSLVDEEQLGMPLRGKRNCRGLALIETLATGRAGG
jgi:hypothetical protein